MRSPITTHVLDTATGRPAAGIPVELFSVNGETPALMGRGITDADGRIGAGLITPENFLPGTYQIRFATEVHFQGTGTTCFYPEVTITFRVTAGQPHYHVPLLLCPFGYTTYRGS